MAAKVLVGAVIFSLFPVIFQTDLLFEQLCDFLFVMFQVIFHLSQPGHRELLPVERTEPLQLVLGLVCSDKEKRKITTVNKRFG